MKNKFYSIPEYFSCVISLGNLVTVFIVALIGGRLTKANEFFFFSGGCAFAMLLMMWLGSNFKYRNTISVVHLHDHDVMDIDNTSSS